MNFNETIFVTIARLRRGAELDKNYNFVVNLDSLEVLLKKIVEKKLTAENMSESMTWWLLSRWKKNLMRDEIF